MGEYDAVWVFIISAIFVGFYIFIEARPKGSTFLKDISNSFFRFFRKDNFVFFFKIFSFYICNSCSYNWWSCIF